MKVVGEYLNCHFKIKIDYGGAVIQPCNRPPTLYAPLNELLLVILTCRVHITVYTRRHIKYPYSIWTWLRPCTSPTAKRTEVLLLIGRRLRITIFIFLSHSQSGCCMVDSYLIGNQFISPYSKVCENSTKKSVVSYYYNLKCV